MSSKDVKKKGPGRPRKTPEKESLPNHGIVSSPLDKNCGVEFTHTNVLAFKKIFNFFKLLAVEHVQIIFRKDHVIMWCMDHHHNNEVRVKINTQLCNRYYCDDVLDIGLSRKNIGSVISKIDKHYNSITFKSYVEDSRKHLYIILKNYIDIDEESIVDLTNSQKMTEEKKFTDVSDYTMSLELPCKYYKKMITDIKNSSQQMDIIQESSRDPLIFSFATADRQVRTKNVVRDKEKVQFKSKLSDDAGGFRVAVGLSYIEPISSAQLSEKILLYFHEKKEILSILNMDVGIEIRILTKIISQKSK